MMGRTHATSGAVAYLLAVPALTRYGVDTTGLSIAVGTVAAAGAAMLPDFDHQHATISQALGPVTKAMALGIEAVSGGHRNGTHSLLGIAAFTYGAVWINRVGGIWLGIWLAFLFAVATAALRVKLAKATTLHYLVSGVGGVILVSTSTFANFPVDVIVWAVGIGAAAHVLGDMLTKQGCPLLWPVVKTRFRFMTLTTDGFTERVIVGPGLGLLALALVAYHSDVPGLVNQLQDVLGV